jgi:Ca2+-binding RTX toxin-like protein
MVVGTDGGDVLYGDFHDNSMYGFAGDDVFEGGAGNDHIDGGAGLDTALYAGNAASFDVALTSGGITVSDKSGAEGTDSLLNTERIRFSDGAIAFDLDGNAGQAFRIYQAAFDRAPDLSGLGFWIAQMDRGVSLQALASSFIQSEEFGDLYGTSLSVDAFVTQLYQNVLHRAAEPDGYAYWFNALNANDTLEMRAAVLASFSEGFENVGQVAQVIAAGIEYIPYA